MEGQALVDDNILTELDNRFTSTLIRVVERTAIAAARFKGLGDEVDADEAAVTAMHAALNMINMRGRVVIGEGIEGECDKLFVGERIGHGDGAVTDIAADPLEGMTQCAKALPGALTAIAVSEENSFLKVPAVYMDKIAIGPGYPDGIIDLDASAADNLGALAKAKNCSVSDLTVCVLDRPRHGRLIDEVRTAGVAVNLIGDGDISGVFQTTDPDGSGVDMYLGIGGAPEGILGAATIKCRGGQMQGRLKVFKEEHRLAMKASDIQDIDRKYDLDELVRGDVIFAATGVTSGWMLEGVQMSGGAISTESVIMNSKNRTIRWVTMERSNVEADHLSPGAV